MQINTDNIAQQCLNAINDRIHNLKRLNIIVIGKSGVGKSTLINSLFRGNFADTGLGRPVTQEIRKIEKTDILWQSMIHPALNCHIPNRRVSKMKSLN